MLDDLITRRQPPPNRVTACEGDLEDYLSEGAVMVAFAMYLFRTMPGLKHVAIHPDGEHGKRFDFRDCLKRRGFELTAPKGKTSYGGNYLSVTGQTVEIDPSSGLGDVVAVMGDTSIVAECKGGVINTKHPGQLSRLRQGLCETIGLSLASPIVKGTQQFVVVPRTITTERLAERIAPRARVAGIQIALIDRSGGVSVVP